MLILDSPKHRAAALVVALAAVVLVALVPFAPGLIGAPILYALVAPTHRRLARRMPRAAAALTVLGVVLVVLGPLGTLGAMLAAEGPNALARLRTSAELGQLAALEVGGVPVGAHLVQRSEAVLAWASHAAVGFAGTLLAGLLHFVIACVGLYCLLASGDALWAQARALLPFSAPNAERLRRRFYHATHATVIGVGTIALLQGVVVGATFAVVGLPNAAFWGAVSVGMGAVPIVGTTPIWAAAAVALALEGRAGAALTLIGVCGVGLTNLDHIIRPLVYRRFSNTHPMVALVGILAGLHTIGPVGIVLGPLAITYCGEVYRMYRAEYEPGLTFDVGDAPAPIERATAPATSVAAPDRAPDTAPPAPSTPDAWVDALTGWAGA